MTTATSSTLQFACQPGCSKCCEVSGYVYLTEEDVTNVARHLGLSQVEFEARYIYRTRHTRRIRKPRQKSKQCPFLVDGGCSIHPVKPLQCRLFPFWPELVEDRKAWKQTSKWCPGIGQGPLIQIGTALELANQMRRYYPETGE
ncbi:MAG: YkgJ family cysteine cluster protein [Acidobacteria bacterium]|nr:YkgJ family cysteine cluster protein [Acidobacteriota bacterium]